MKAAVVHTFGQPPRFEPFTLPVTDHGVPVDVLAAALSPRARAGAAGSHYAGSRILPVVPGIDGVGRLADGRLVYFLPASDRMGTFAERTLAAPRLIAPLPADISPSRIAAGMLPALSSWVALTLRAPLRAGQSVLVLGATGVSGRLAIQIAKHLGAGRIIGAGRDQLGLARLRSLGADDVVQLTGSKDDGPAIAKVASDVDIVLDYLWGSVTTTALPAVCRFRAAEDRALMWVLIGSAAGDEIPLSSVLLRKRNLHILGSGQGATSTSDIFSCVPPIVTALHSGALELDERHVPLASVEAQWSEAIPSGSRLVFLVAEQSHG